MKKKKLLRNPVADHAVEFINKLTLTGDYSGESLTLRPFQEPMIRDLIGTIKNGKRQYTKAAWLLPRKQGKSQLAAAFLIYCLVNFPPGQTIISVGQDRTQARVIYEQAVQMLEQDPELREEFGIEIQDSKSRITILEKHSVYVALSKDTNGNKLGFNPSVLFLDEAQELSPDKVKKLTSAMAARKEPLTIYCGTAGDRKDTVGYDMFEYAKKVEAGTIKNPHFLPCLWYAKPEEEKDWDSPKLWKKVIPALGDYVSLDFYKEECELAKHLPRKKSEFCQYYLNLQQSPTSSWIYDTDWMLNKEVPLGCSEYIAGLDVASVNDTSSFVLLGKNEEGTFDVIPITWVCRRQVEQRAEAESLYPLWEKQGLLRVTDGDCQDQEVILQDIVELCREYNVTKIGVDRYGMQWMGPKMLDQLGETEVVAVDQGIVSISEPLKQLERLVLQQQLRHGGHELLRWMASNAKVTRDANDNIKLSKKGAERMDGIQALAIATALYDWSGWEASNKTSVYEKQGVMVF